MYLVLYYYLHFQTLDPLYNPPLWKTSLKSIHSEYEYLYVSKPTDSKLNMVEQDIGDGSEDETEVVVDGKINSTASSSDKEVEIEAGQIGINCLLIEDTQEQDHMQVMCHKTNDSDAQSNPYIDAQPDAQPNTHIDAQPNHAQLLDKNRSKETGAKNYFITAELEIIPILLPDISEQSSHSTAPLGYVGLDHSTHQSTQTTEELHYRLHFDLKMEEGGKQTLGDQLMCDGTSSCADHKNRSSTQNKRTDMTMYGFASDSGYIDNSCSEFEFATTRD